MMNTSLHDSNQNSQNNFEISQSFKNDSNDNNAVTKSSILSKNMTSETFTLTIKKLKKSFTNKNHKSH